MFLHVKRVLDELERSSYITERDEVYSLLRSVGLDDFGEILFSMPNPDYPRLSGILPAMASIEVQKAWTGNHGRDLLRQTSDFVRSLMLNYQILGKKSIDNSTILDFGCGYGRIARMMYYFTNERNVFGVDPWRPSIDECNIARLGNNFLLSEYMLAEIPHEIRFDLAYAFSVFTHLSQRTALAAFEALRKCANPGAMLCITVRPVEYWDILCEGRGSDEAMFLKELHINDEYAFYPHSLNSLDNGTSTYGDTGISINWLRKNLNAWTIIRIDHSLSDPYQIYVYLTPKR